MRTAAFLLALGLAAALAPAPPAQDTPRKARDAATDDPEDREARELMARRAVEDNCLICHADELVAGQRLTPKQWKAEVEKMVGWGSPLPPEMQGPVVEYLSARYPDTAPPPELHRTSYPEAARRVGPEDLQTDLPAQDVERGGPLYVRHCANCHASDGQGAELGPNLVEKPVLLRSNDYSEIVRKGRGRMPGFSTLLSPSEEAQILAWLRARRYRPVAVK
jgi:mono/diheme cytochrome c family protein